MEHYVSEASRTLRTDKQSLKYMGDQRLIQSIQNKLLIKLLGYNYKIEYKKGKENKATDALSRRAHINNSMAITSAIPLWVNEELDSYIEDAKCREVDKQLRISPTVVPNFTMVNGLIRHKGKILGGSTTGLRKKLLDSFHNSVLGGHSGERVTYNKIKSLFYWPGMKNDISEFIKSCPTCQLNKSENIPYPGLFLPLPIPDMAF
jgi:hypothetical protein